jgi:hypothetical protein
MLEGALNRAGKLEAAVTDEKPKRLRPLTMVIPTIAGAPTVLDLERKISVQEAAALNTISEDTFLRHYRHLVRQVSPRRGAVRLGDALAIGEVKQSA